MDRPQSTDLSQLFDFAVSSEIALPELASSDGLPVRYRYRQPQEPIETPANVNWVWEWKLPTDEVFLSVGRLGQDYILRFPGVADFEVLEEGSVIRGHADPGIPQEVIRHLLLDHVIPRLESHAGRLVLHGSAVANEDGVLVFLGPTGSGKSTLSASFREAGWDLLTDDCVLLKEDGDRLEAVAAYPGLRLWPESLAGMGLESSERKSEISKVWKTRLNVGSATIAAGPVKAIFVLQVPEESSPNTEVSITPVRKAAALTQLLQHGFVLDPSDRSTLEKYFLSAGEAVRSLPMFSLAYPREFSLLASIREAVERALVSRYSV